MPLTHKERLLKEIDEFPEETIPKLYRCPCKKSEKMHLALFSFNVEEFLQVVDPGKKRKRGLKSLSVITPPFFNRLPE